MAMSQQPPSRFLGYKLKQFFLRVDPSAVITIADHLRAAEEQQLSDDTVLEKLQAAYGVGPDGWPLEMEARRVSRLKRFYLTNRPDEIDKSALLLRLEGTDDELMEAIFRRYGRNEIGESVDPEENLRESLVHVINCVNPALLHTVDKMMEKRAATGIPHREFFEKCCAHFNVGTDGWPAQWKERRAARLRRFFAINDPKKSERAVARLLGEEYSDQDIFTALYKQYGKDELGVAIVVPQESPQTEEPSSLQAERAPEGTVQETVGSAQKAGLQSSVLSFQQSPQLPEEQTVERTSHLVDDDQAPRRLKSRRKGEQQRDVTTAPSPAAEAPLRTASSARGKTKASARRTVSRPAPSERFDKSRHFVASVAPQLARDFESLAAEAGATDEQVLQRLYFLGGFDNKGSPLLSDEEKTRIKALLYHFVEEYVPEEEVVSTVSQLASVGRSEQEIWAVAQERFATIKPKPSKLRQQLRQIYKRARPEDLGRISAMMVCKYEEGLTDEEVLAEVCKRLQVDLDGWPSNPVLRKRQRLARFFERNDPKKLVLIDTYYLKLPKSEGELMNGLFRQYGVDELGNRVSAPPAPEVSARQIAADEVKLRRVDFQQLLKSDLYQRLVLKYGGESLLPAADEVRLLGDEEPKPAEGSPPRFEFPFRASPARTDLVSPVHMMNLSNQETADFVKQRNNVLLTYDPIRASEEILVSPEVFATTAPPRGVYHVQNTTTIPDPLAGWRNYIFTERPMMHGQLDAAALTGRQRAEESQQAQSQTIRRATTRVPWIDEEEGLAAGIDDGSSTTGAEAGVRRAKN